MIIEPAKERILNMEIHGKVGFTAGVGMARCGYTRLGASKDFGGVYARKIHGAGVSTRAPKRGGRFAPSRMRYYRPLETSARAANPARGWFADAVSAYRALTDDERAMLDVQARRRSSIGYRYFISQYIQSHRT